MAQDNSENRDTDASFPRRAIFKGAVAGTVLSTLPWGLRQAFSEQAFDLIVIGGGTAGLPAAILAADRGARVVIIEKAPLVGGTLFLSGGLMAAANTVFQKAKGIEDSPDAHYEDVMRISNNTSDPVMARLWADHGGRLLTGLPKTASPFATHIRSRERATTRTQSGAISPDQRPACPS